MAKVVLCQIYNHVTLASRKDPKTIGCGNGAETLRKNRGNGAETLRKDRGNSADTMRNTGSTVGSLRKDCGHCGNAAETAETLRRDCGHSAARAQNKCGSAADAASECTPGPPYYRGEFAHSSLVPPKDVMLPMRNTGGTCTAGSLLKDCGIAAERLRTLRKDCGHCGNSAERLRT